MKSKEWLKKMREKFGLSQKQLSEETGINKFTIENIEQDRRKGSEETWKVLEDFFESRANNCIQISTDNDDLIDEIKEDIKEFGEDWECILIYKKIGKTIIFIDYDFDPEEMPFDEKELKPGEKYIKTTLKYALQVFEEQNKII